MTDDHTRSPWMAAPLREELRRRGVDPAELNHADVLDVGVALLGRDYVEARWRERTALRALRRMLEEVPDADNEDPADHEPGSWALPVPLLAASAEVQNFDRARLRRHGLGQQFAGLLAAWRDRRDRHDPAAPPTEGGGPEDSGPEETGTQA